MLYPLLYFLFSIKVATCNCRPEINKDNFTKAAKYYNIQKVGKLPKLINESSGLARSSEKDLFWTHNDGGGKSELYLIDLQGNLHQTWKINAAQNIDWEDLTQDDNGNVYIGDFGNNNNSRKDLTIYKVNKQHTEKITFAYADQHAFPPDEKERNFDCEAFFWFNGRLYLFSKNRGTALVKLYSMPAHSGHYTLVPSDSLFIKSQVTGADISPDGKTFVLLTYGKILFFEIQDETINFSKPHYCLKFARTQTEGIVFVNNSDVLVSNEQGKLYLIRKNLTFR